jgi:hypothetical protein
VRESLSVANLTLYMCTCSAALMAAELSSLYGTNVYTIACESGGSVISCADFKCPCTAARRLLQTVNTQYVIVYQSTPKEADTRSISSAIQKVVPTAQVTEKVATVLQTTVVAWDPELVTWLPPMAVPVWFIVVMVVVCVGLFVASFVVDPWRK